MGVQGATGWDWNSVLPYFKKVERDMDFDGPWHGKEGRIPVRRIFPDLWPEHAKAVGKAFEQAGYKFIQDQNAEWEDGYFPITISNAYERRVSAAIGYLDPGTRMRENLTISTDTQASGLIFDGQRCVGVKAVVAGKPAGIPRQGDHPVLRRDPFPCASAAGRDRAGGASAGAWDRGSAALPGVGQRLQDHPAVAVAAFLKPHARIINDYTRRHIYTALRYSSKLPGIPAGRHVHRGDQQDILARGRRADRIVHRDGLQDLLGNRLGPAAVGKWTRSRRWISTCCRISATWSG